MRVFCSPTCVEIFSPWQSGVGTTLATLLACEIASMRKKTVQSLAKKKVNGEENHSSKAKTTL